VGEFEICRDRLGGAASDDDDCGWSISGINGREVGGGGGDVLEVPSGSLCGGIDEPSCEM